MSPRHRVDVDDDKRYDVSAAVKGKEADLAAVAEGDSGDDSVIGTCTIGFRADGADGAGQLKMS